MSLQWRWVTEGLAEVTFDLICRTEIQLLEEFGRDGDGTSSAHAIESLVSSEVSMEMAIVHF